MPDEIPRPDPVEPPNEPDSARDDAEPMTPEELAEAKRYGRCNLAGTLVDKFVDLAFMVVVALGLAQPLDAWLSGWPLLDASRSLRLVALLAIVFGLNVLISLPLSFYSGHVLEHRFRLSNQTFLAWLWRYAKRAALAGTFGVILFVGLFWLIWTTGPYWWLTAAAAFFVVSVVLGQLAPVLILPLFYKVQRLDVAELGDRLGRLVEGTGLSIEGVYRIDLSRETTKAGAMLAGLGRTRRVLLGDTLLDRFTPEEIEVVFAHEVGHHVYRHIRKLILAGLFSSAAGFWICDRILAAWAGTGADGLDYANLPVAAAGMVMLMLTVFATVVEPLQNSISRRYERQCDRYALRQTGVKAWYLSAFRKLARMNKADPDPHWLEVFLFHSHPPIGRRLALAEEE